MISYRSIVQILGYQTYALWVICAVILSLLQMGNAGIGPAVAKLMAEVCGRDDLDSARKVLRTALKVVLLAGLGLTAVARIAAPSLLKMTTISPESQLAVAALLPWVGVLSVYVIVVDTFSYALAGIGHIRVLYAGQACNTIVATSVSIGLLHAGYGLSALLIGQALGYATLHICSALVLRRILGKLGLFEAPLDMRGSGRLLRLSRDLMGSTVLQLVMVPVNRLILAQWGDLTAITVYELANNGSMRIRSLFETGLRALMPEVSRLHASGSVGRVEALWTRAYKWMGIVVVPAYVLLIIAVPYMVSLWLGASNLPVLTPAVRIALMGTLASLLGVPAYYILLGTGATQPLLFEKAFHWAVSLAVLAVLCIPLGYTNSLFILGAGSAGMAVSSLYLFITCRRMLQRLMSASPEGTPSINCNLETITST